MADLLEKLGFAKLQNVIIYGFVAALILAFLAKGISLGDHGWWAFIFRWLHVMSGVMWIGLLWYLNFVQTASMPKIPDDQKPAITKVIAPTVFWYFRYGALSTVITGLILAWMNGYIVDALTLGIQVGGGRPTAIGIGMWLGLIMAYNVWMIIWPNQQKLLGLVDATPEEKKAAAKPAAMASRFNTMASIPMLYFMVSAQNIY
jgi:uncharacterized membrane protein